MATIIPTITFCITCPICGNEHYVTVGKEGFEKWQNGELAQNAFPYLLPSQREQLISELCPKCQADLFGEDSEEDEDESYKEDVKELMRESLEFTGQWW